MDKDLRALLNAFDGVHTDTLEEIAAMLPADRSTIEQLCELAAGDDRKLQTAATWLLKRFSEKGLLFNATQSFRASKRPAAREQLGSALAPAANAGQAVTRGRTQLPATYGWR